MTKDQKWHGSLNCDDMGNSFAIPFDSAAAQFEAVRSRSVVLFNRNQACCRSHGDGLNGSAVPHAGELSHEERR